MTNPVTKQDLNDLKNHTNSNTKCPTVEDIVGGIFPGRNSGLTRGGKYFTVQSDDNYNLLPNKNNIEPTAPSQDEVLDPPLRWSNVQVPLNDIKNSIDLPTGSYTDTNIDSKTRRRIMKGDGPTMNSDLSN